MLDRPLLVQRWQLNDHDMVDAGDPSALLCEVAADRDHSPWPVDVAPRDLADAMERTGDADAKQIATALLDGLIFPKPATTTRRLLGIQDRAYTRTVDSGMRRVGEELGRCLTRWPVLACALLVSLEKDVRAGVASYRHTPIPSTRRARAAMATVSRGLGGEWSKAVPREERGRVVAHSMELVWRGGRSVPYQLALELPGAGLTSEVVRGILRELSEDGLRDYLVLHRMAAEQGRSGHFQWTWREHKERTAYAARIRASTTDAAEARREVTGRLFRLKGAELRETYQKGDAVVWRRVGPFGLIDIPAGCEVDGGLEQAVLTLNPSLYEGASAGAGADAHFTLLPDEAFALRGDRFRLSVMLTLAMRANRDQGGAVRLRAGGLWEYMNARGGDERSIQRRRWPETDAALGRSLDALADARVIGSWEREGTDVAGPQVMYRIEPRPEWRDLVVHGVSPVFPPALMAVPRTGAELRAWRAAKGLSQRSAALTLGVATRTILRAENGANDSLGPALTRALVRNHGALVRVEAGAP